jgi:hypothetical protein
MSDDGTPVADKANPEGQLPPRRSRFRRLSRFTPPEIVAAVLLLSSFLFAAGFVASSPGVGGDWQDTIDSWAGWAAQLWLPVMLLLAALIAWYCAANSRDGLLAADNSPRDLTGDAGLAHNEDVGAAELWNRERRALVISGLTAVLGALAALAVILVVVVDKRPASSQGVVLYPSRVAAVLEGLASLVPALASVVIFGQVRGVWSDLVSAVKPSEAGFESPSQPSLTGFGPPSSAFGPRRRL